LAAPVNLANVVQTMKNLVLASTSPYRRELLLKLGHPFICQAPDFDEAPLKLSHQLSHRGSLEDLVRALAKGKARSVIAKNALVIGSDQMAVLGTERLGKPGTRASAIAQLKKLAGHEHQLLTAVHLCVYDELSRLETEVHFLNITKLKMRALTDLQIETYVDLDQPFDCAGSYKFEQSGIRLMSAISCTDPSAIQGLPLIELNAQLEKYLK
jgi:septum formation protein